MTKKRRMSGKQALKPAMLPEVEIIDADDDYGTSSFGGIAWPVSILLGLSALITVSCWTAVTSTSATARRQFYAVMHLPFTKVTAAGPPRQVQTAPAPATVGLTAWGFELLQNIGVPNELYHLLMYMTQRFKLQDLLMVEYFCGEKAVTNAFGKCCGKKRVKGYDIKHDPHNQNLNTGDGFLLALCWLLRLIEAEGLSWWGTVCSSWIWLARGHSRRTKQLARGNTKVPSVAEGNKMVSRMALLLALCYSKSLSWALEQPRNSLMIYHPAMLYLCSRIRAAGLHLWSIQTFMGAFNGETVKPHTIYSNECWIKALERKHPGKKGGSANVVKKWVDASGRAKCAGGSDLKATQTYTPEFGEAAAQGFVQCRQDPVFKGELYVQGEDELDWIPTPSFAEAWEDLDLPEIMDALKKWSPASAR